MTDRVEIKCINKTKHATDHQVRRYMDSRKDGHSQAAAGAASSRADPSRGYVGNLRYLL